MVLNNHFNLCLENKTHYVYLFFILLAYGRFKVGKFFSAHPVGAVKRLKFWYGVYNQSKTEKNDGISDKKRLLKPMYIAT